jgi:hypothetical protein
LVLLALCCAFVISAEMFNSAVEALVDKASPEYSPLAKAAKDAAAGAALFWDIKKFKEIADFFLGNIPAFLALAVSFALSGVFVFAAGASEGKDFRRSPND